MRSRSATQGPYGDLTWREIQVLQFVADGFTNRVIGERLSIGTETVKDHLTHLFQKLQAYNRGHAVAEGFRYGLIT